MSDIELDKYAYPGTRFAQDGTIIGQGQGMSLRDWFAGQALVGLIANPGNADAQGGKYFSKAAYQVADAMMMARTTPADGDAQ